MAHRSNVVRVDVNPFASEQAYSRSIDVGEIILSLILERKNLLPIIFHTDDCPAF